MKITGNYSIEIQKLPLKGTGGIMSDVQIYTILIYNFYIFKTR